MDNFQLRTLEEDCLKILKEGGAEMVTEKTGEHYLLASGRHAKLFYQVSHALERAADRERMARLMLMKMLAAGVIPKEINVLLGPAVGALPLLYTMQHFSDLAHTRAIYVERSEKNKEDFELARGFSLKPDEMVYIIDDVGTTFGTVRKTIYAANQACAAGGGGWDAYIVGFAVLIDRTHLGFPSPNIFAPTLKYICGLRIPSETFSQEECPCCKEGIKLVRV